MLTRFPSLSDRGGQSDCFSISLLLADGYGRPVKMIFGPLHYSLGSFPPAANVVIKWPHIGPRLNPALSANWMRPPTIGYSYLNDWGLAMHSWTPAIKYPQLTSGTLSS